MTHLPATTARGVSGSRKEGSQLGAKLGVAPKPGREPRGRRHGRSRSPELRVGAVGDRTQRSLSASRAPLFRVQNLAPRPGKPGNSQTLPIRRVAEGGLGAGPRRSEGQPGVLGRMDPPLGFPAFPGRMDHGGQYMGSPGSAREVFSLGAGPEGYRYDPWGARGEEAPRMRGRALTGEPSRSVMEPRGGSRGYNGSPDRSGAPSTSSIGGIASRHPYPLLPNAGPYARGPAMDGRAGRFPQGDPYALPFRIGRQERDEQEEIQWIIDEERRREWEETRGRRGSEPRCVGRPRQPPDPGAGRY